MASRPTADARPRGRARSGSTWLWTAGCLVAIAGLTFSPPRFVSDARHLFISWFESMSGAPVLSGVAGFQFLANVAMFVPFGALITLVLGRRRWAAGLASGVALSVVVEVTQVVLPGRVPDADDVVANSIGTALGVGLVALLGLGGALVRTTRARFGTSRHVQHPLPESTRHDQSTNQ